MFQDVTGTTIYVVGVICVIPAAGLVAWVVRYVVRKKVILIKQRSVVGKNVILIEHNFVVRMKVMSIKQSFVERKKWFLFNIFLSYEKR